MGCLGAARIYAKPHTYIGIALHVYRHRLVRIEASPCTYIRVASSVYTCSPTRIYASAGSYGRRGNRWDT